MRCAHATSLPRRRGRVSPAPCRRRLSAERSPAETGAPDRGAGRDGRRNRKLAAAIAERRGGTRQRLDVLARDDRRLPGGHLEDPQGHGERGRGDGAAAERTIRSASSIRGRPAATYADLHVYDIVLGADTVNLGSFKTGYRDARGGEQIRRVEPLDLMRTEGSAGQDPNARTMRRFAVTRSCSRRRARRRTVPEGQGRRRRDRLERVWNSEIDRIQRFHDQFGTTAKRWRPRGCRSPALFQRSVLGIRVVSNNITNGGGYDGKTGEACQSTSPRSSRPISLGGNGDGCRKGCGCGVGRAKMRVRRARCAL